MRERRQRERLYEEERPYTWLLYAVAMLLVGGLAGFILAANSARPGAGPLLVASPAAAGTAAGSVVDENQLRAYRDILTRDPKNVEAAVAAGNMLYDAKRYLEAVPFYQQALAVKPDINVSTDLGTALWYSGQPDAALTQYQQSLGLDPSHAQTLFNIGIVKSDGKSDFTGAAAAWQSLLDSNPTYANAANVRTLIAGARAKAAARGN